VFNTVAVNCLCFPAVTCAEVGEMLTATGRATVTTADPDLAGSATDVATTETWAGLGGLLGAVYTPLPGSSKRFVMFAGPSITLADHHYLQTLYGVSAQQSLASGHPEYLITHNGTVAAGVGFSATKFLGKHWLVNLDLAISQLRGDPVDSPILERRTQRVIALSFDYHHETSNPQ